MEMKLNKKATELKDRYLRYGMTESQLERYKNLGVITEEEFNYIKMLRYSLENI